MMNLKNVNAKKLLPDEKYQELIERQATGSPQLMEFIQNLLLDRMAQSDDLSSDDPNWCIKRALKDGRTSELKFLYNILFKE
jgi:hypothetical protein